MVPPRRTLATAAQDHRRLFADDSSYPFVRSRPPDAALATMTEDPYVLAIPSGRGGSGRAGAPEYYANQFLPKNPPDFELTSLSQTFGNDRLIEEFVIRFTHTLEMDWMLPGLPATGRSVEFALVGIIQFQAGKVAKEHIYWDQATVLSQLGVLDHPVAAAGVGSTAKLLKLRNDRSWHSTGPQSCWQRVCLLRHC
jgi:carboxymethylenebutenolidase